AAEAAYAARAPLIPGADFSPTSFDQEKQKREARARKVKAAGEARKRVTRPTLGIAAADALGEIGPPAKKKAARALQKLLSDRFTGKLDARRLAEMAKRDKVVLAHAERLAEMAEERLKAALARALSKIDPASARTVKHLTAALERALEDARRRSAEAAVL